MTEHDIEIPLEDFFDALRAANSQRNATEFDPQARLGLDFMVNELGGEVGELQNVLKKLHREARDIPGSRARPGDLEGELADVVIVADLVALKARLPTLDFRVIVTPHDTLTMGIMLNSACGHVSKIALNIWEADAHEHLWMWLCTITEIVYAIARHFGLLSIENLVVRKFNATSRKLNFKTFMELTSTGDRH